MLNDAGPESVQSWTAKKGINVFKKKLIFIPINKDLHWSLCVVVNPGSIPYSGEEPKPEDQLPCLIFMDSLKMHNKNQVSKNIRKWLNSEWQRLKADETKVSSPFAVKNFTLFNPAGK
jgi:sentrin-specific protease 7